MTNSTCRRDSKKNCGTTPADASSNHINQLNNVLQVNMALKQLNIARKSHQYNQNVRTQIKNWSWAANENS